MIWDFKQRFSVFKQHYMYFHILFHPHIFLKNTKNVTRITLPKGLVISKTLKKKKSKKKQKKKKQRRSNFTASLSYYDIRYQNSLNYHYTFRFLKNTKILSTTINLKRVNYIFSYYL